jgi:TRAP-type mannitol/chloroaromatic compound transport system substrate-binding protein
MQQRSYQNNVEFHKMMQRAREDAKKEENKIIQNDASDRLLKLKEDIYKVQRDSQKNLLAEKENDAKARMALNEEHRKFMDNLRKY